MDQKEHDADTGSHTLTQDLNASDSQSSDTTIPMVSFSTLDTMGVFNSFFQNAQGINISGNPSFHNIGSVTNVHGGRDGMEYLNGFISFEAQFDSSAQDPRCQCHPGTRKNVLERLRDWFDNPKAKERIFWLYGPMGAGKSAIAQTIARSYAKPKVAATFFFFRSDVNRNDGNLLFTTLAYQLSLSLPSIRDHIANSLSNRPDLPKTDVETQFNQLLARPFQDLNDSAIQELAPVIVIDGVDECTDENLQQRFLELIGNAVKNSPFPLRFLIVSRPEPHIAYTIRRFRIPILTIDLAELDDASDDIEKYLLDEFSRIASEQRLDSTWPGKKIIDDIVHKSSGNFIFASLVIKFVGDRDFLAKNQLDIVMNIKPAKIMSPFAILDQLYLEILKRVRDQDFLQRYLALFVARISLSSDYGDLYKDDAMLMHVSEEELLVNLRRLPSLFKFEPRIDVHHQSFLHFLQDPARSGYYHSHDGIKGYMEVFVRSLVRYVSSMIEQPTHHDAPCFTPGFGDIVKCYPPKINLSIEEWQEVIQPLLGLQDKLLQRPDFASAQGFSYCDECTVFYLLRELLHLGLHLGFRPVSASVGEMLVSNLRKRQVDISQITTKTRNSKESDLDNMLQSLFARLPEKMEDRCLSEDIINLVNAILRFGHANTVTRILSVSDAQKLVDILDYMIHAKKALDPAARREASLLALEIFARVPIVPLSYFSTKLRHHLRTYKQFSIETLSQTIFVSLILDHRSVVPLLLAGEGNNRVMLLSATPHGNGLTISQWRQRSIPSFLTTIRIPFLETILTHRMRLSQMLRLAKAIQYLHSMGILLDRQFCSDNILLSDSGLPLSIHCCCSTSRLLLDQECQENFSQENNIFSLGCLFHELYAGPDSERRDIKKHTSVYVWRLIHRCCASDPNSRPTIDEVVKEMESWRFRICTTVTICFSFLFSCFLFFSIFCFALLCLLLFHLALVSFSDIFSNFKSVRHNKRY